MIPVTGYKGQRVGVLGLGRSGLATAQALSAGGAIPVCWDDNEAARDNATEFEIADLSRDKNWEGITTLIVSPGIPHLFPAPHPAVKIAWERGVVVDNDISLFFQSFAQPEWSMFDHEPKIVCITGSNGKSTTAALIAHILQSANRPVQLGGNFGTGALSLDPMIDNEVVILELSSYQLELARILSPDIAVFLNLSPDHLDRHAGLGGYFAAKARLFTTTAPDRAILGMDQPEGCYLENRMLQSGTPVIQIANRKLPGDGWQVYSRKGFLAERRKGRQLASIDLREMSGLPGSHNRQNACAAYAVCRSLGLAPKVIETGLQSYAGLRHRCQKVADIDGIAFVNDSKATNADSVGKSLKAFENIRWIAGGQKKEGGIAELTPLFGRIAKAYLIGEAAKDFSVTLGETPHEICETLENAVIAAKRDAQKGDTVLLAPACASFDQFDNFEARGTLFEKMVQE
ncbi:MAG: UDP-N-acetylmuramoyl-L-alanine--D-glutamate ligase [Rhodobacteraceae bacterium]|nr:UDP-N-acetylmuramoyl-L-alanine--D-glutamate ligase [Paracoccaceae bacterium]